MRARLAAALGSDATLVNVKASNPEGFGALGARRRTAAAAIVILRRIDRAKEGKARTYQGGGDQR